MTLAHPIRLIECRNYKGHSLETTLSGLSVRLEEDKKKNLEPDFPDSHTFVINGQKFCASIYVFKENSDKNYRTNEGVLFTLNGQTHGSFKKTFFKRRAVGLSSYIAESLLLVVDCSNIDDRTREDLFMNSRDRLREGSLKKEIENALENILKHHPGLNALQEERRRNAITKKLEDQKPLAEVLNNILKNSPTLSTLFLTGNRLPNPFKLTPAKASDKFKGMKYPTYFILKNKTKRAEYIKHAPIDHKFRVQFETDVMNNYFDRAVDPGTFDLQ